MCRILLVDDEYLEREALRIIINRGVKEAQIVGETGFGKKAVQLTEELDPDIIFMDIKMPGMDGIEASKIIKEKNRDRIVIILTAYDEFEFAHKAIKAHVDDYILKPARPETILRAINSYIESIKVRRNSTQMKIQSLMNKIRKRDYKGAKEEFQKVIQHMTLLYSNDLKELKAKCKDLADEMLKISAEIGLNLDKIDKMKSELNFSDDVYLIEQNLFRILNEIFKEIIDKKLYDFQDDFQDDINAVLNYIERNFHKGISLEEVAEYINLSPYYLSKLFKKEMEMNFITYVTNRKIERAKELLENSNLPILNISLDLSFNEPNYFSKVFKKATGMTPSQYRDKKQREKRKKAEKLKNNLMKRNVPITNGRWYI